MRHALLYIGSLDDGPAIPLSYFSHTDTRAHSAATAQCRRRVLLGENTHLNTLQRRFRPIAMTGGNGAEQRIRLHAHSTRKPIHICNIILYNNEQYKRHNNNNIIPHARPPDRVLCRAARHRAFGLKLNHHRRDNRHIIECALTYINICTPWATNDLCRKMSTKTFPP